MRRATATALSIAGSDSGGGAGVQADLKAFARCGVHGTCAITAITAQSTVGVRAVHQVPAEIILAQVQTVLEDIGADAVKVGMLGSAASARAVARALEGLPRGTPVVVDPVMLAESGARLLAPGARRVLVEEVIPRASVITPNLPEARMLTGRRRPAAGQDEREQEAEARGLALELLGLGAPCVVLTGGHRHRAVDLFAEHGRTGGPVAIGGVRHPGGAAHGSGCTHSSVLAAQLALGRDRLQAARIARRLAGAAVAQGLREIGAGAGPVDVLGIARRAQRARPRRRRLP